MGVAEMHKALGQMTKDETYAEAGRRGARIAADVVWSRGRRPFSRLIGLVALLRAGRRVGVDCTSLVIDGRHTDWVALERAADEA
jgi:hypothetical protein